MKSKIGAISGPTVLLLWNVINQNLNNLHNLCCYHSFSESSKAEEEYTSSEEGEETPQEKRLRLAKQYIEDLKNQGKKWLFCFVKCQVSIYTWEILFQVLTYIKGGIAQRNNALYGVNETSISNDLHTSKKVHCFVKYQVNIYTWDTFSSVSVHKRGYCTKK